MSRMQHNTGDKETDQNINAEYILEGILLQNVDRIKYNVPLSTGVGNSAQGLSTNIECPWTTEMQGTGKTA